MSILSAGCNLGAALPAETVVSHSGPLVSLLPLGILTAEPMSCDLRAGCQAGGLSMFSQCNQCFTSRKQNQPDSNDNAE